MHLRNHLVKCAVTNTNDVNPNNFLHLLSSLIIDDKCFYNKLLKTLGMNIRFNGKRILVAGAGRGIGRDLVKAFAKGGTTVVALSRTQEHLDSWKAECPLIQTNCADVGSCNCHISFADTWFGQ